MKVSSGRWVGGLAGLVMSVTFGGLAFGAEFSADVLENRRGTTVTGKVFVKGDKMRREMMAAGKTRIAIVRQDKGVVWNLVPDRQIYVETTNQRGSDWDSPEMTKQLEKVADRQVAGSETVNGYECEKVQYVYKDTAMGTRTHWISKKLKYTIKMEHRSSTLEMSSEFQNIKEGGVADSVFEVPQGYQKMDMPGTPGGTGGPQPRPMTPQQGPRVSPKDAGTLQPGAPGPQTGPGNAPKSETKAQ
jgi:hypothetical protein